ncbi:MAG: hypothetical protein IT449_15690 [Phycisphaerales bacterium]|nr:hypothetical protein [Phycisphaerales bacterium]
MPVRPVRRSRAPRRARLPLLIPLILALLTGCGYSGGKLLFASGLFANKKVKPDFVLTTGPILVLVDDPKEVVDWPIFKRLLMDDVSQELLRHKAAEKIIPPETLQSVQQTEADFARRGCREIGELCGADQVLWIEVQDFLAKQDVEDVAEAAYALVTVRVIDVHAENKWRVRVWPDNPQGQVISAKLTASTVQRAGERDAIAKDISVSLSRKIARHFYEYRPADFEGEDE